MDTDFATWLMIELEQRGWTNSELARRAGVVPSTVSMIVSGQKRAGLEFCIGVARAFGLQPEQVLRWAGLLPSLPPAVEEEQELVSILRGLTTTARQTVITMLRSLAGRAYVAMGEGTVPYETAETSQERELLERFRRLDPPRQDAILFDIDQLEKSRIVHIIGEGDEETPAPENAQAA